MAEVVCTLEIQANQETVFEVFSDLEKAPQRIQGIKSLEVLTPLPIGEGTAFRETRIMYGREATEEMTITQFEPPHRYCVEAHSHGTHFVTHYLFEESDQGTHITLRFKGIPKSLFAKLFSFMAIFMMRSVKKCLEDDMKDLKLFIEDLPNQTSIADPQ